MPQETITLGANSEDAVRITGKFFAVISCTGSFKIEVDRGGKRLCSAGVKFSFAQFKRIVFIETSGAANTIVFWADDAQYDGTIPREGDAVPVIAAAGIPLQIVDAETFDYPYLMTTDGALISISHSSTLDIPSAKPLPAQITISGTVYTRKSFHIANRTTDDLAIYKTTGECVDILQENSDRTFNFSFDILIQFLSSGGSNKIALYYTLYTPAP